MSCFNLLLLHFLISATDFIVHSNASELQGEKLVSSFLANEGDFTYQVAIMGKHNYTDELDLICGGAILAERLILTAAQCFVDDTGYHRTYTFVVIAGKVDLHGPGGIERLIELIYLTNAGSFNFNNIALAQLERELGIYFRYSRLRWVEYSSYGETFWGRNGTVAGHGYYNSEVMYSYLHGRELVIHADIDYKLRYGTVNITTYRECAEGQVYINFENQFCGVMFANGSGEKAGICQLDAGIPIVIDNKVVAIANTNHPDCNDVEIGGVYTQVQGYSHFIDKILFNDPMPGTIIYQNRPYIRYRPTT